MRNLDFLISKNRRLILIIKRLIQNIKYCYLKFLQTNKKFKTLRTINVFFVEMAIFFI